MNAKHLTILLIVLVSYCSATVIPKPAHEENMSSHSFFQFNDGEKSNRIPDNFETPTDQRYDEILLAFERMSDIMLSQMEFSRVQLEAMQAQIDQLRAETNRSKNEEAGDTNKDSYDDWRVKVLKTMGADAAYWLFKTYWIHVPPSVSKPATQVVVNFAGGDSTICEQID